MSIFLSITEALLAGRPLPDARFTQELLSSKWMSKENLLSSPEESDDPNLFVALFEFSAGGENQLCLNKGTTRFFCMIKCLSGLSATVTTEYV